VSLGRAVTSQRFEADFIRATVQIEESRSGVIEMKVETGSATADLARIVLRASWSEGVIKTTDLFPRRFWHIADECLPPADEPGDFWAVTVRPKIVLRLPTSMKTSVRVREGHVEDHRSQFRE